MDHTGKFMMSHTFLNVELSNPRIFHQGPTQTFNGIRCEIRCYKPNESEWVCYLHVWNNPLPSLYWKVEYKIRTNNGFETIETRDGKIEDSLGISFQDDPKYIVDGHLKIECHVELYEQDKNGIKIPPMVIESETGRLLDKSVKELSDVVLIVEEKKFYVNKLFFASESCYFKSLFIEESMKDEISLKDVEAKYFQLFLESLYGDPVINDKTVDGILKLADMFDAKRVFKKCEVFLIKESKKSLKEKLDLAVKFNSNELKESCLNQIKTVGDIHGVMSVNPKEMDHDVLAFLLEKSLSLHK